MADRVTRPEWAVPPQRQAQEHLVRAPLDHQQPAAVPPTRQGQVLAARPAREQAAPGQVGQEQAVLGPVGNTKSCCQFVTHGRLKNVHPERWTFMKRAKHAGLGRGQNVLCYIRLSRNEPLLHLTHN